MTAWPRGPLVAFYGDDFTGSTAVMEVLAFAGLPTVLFLAVPTPERLAAFADYPGIGIAGVARSMSPAWMERNLPEVFDFLATLEAPIGHYKVCSTFDSSKTTGSIGRAAELAIPRLGGAWHPLLVAAPAIARYQAFGNLFAAVDGVPYRLDRHPTMARHPVTPMREADLRLHLAEQTATPSALVDLVTLKDGRGADVVEAHPGAIVSIDVIDERTLEAAGALVWNHRGERLFAIGSQGLEYALVAHWRASGLLPPAADPPAAEPAGRIAVVSGSCAPVTARQIDHALATGFRGIALEAATAVDEAAWAEALARAEAAALRALGDGASPLVYTARGPDDPAVARVLQAIEAAGAEPEAVNARIGQGLGRLLRTIVERAELGRAVVAGGDSSGHATMALGIDALTARAPLAPGAPLCLAHGGSRPLELVLKGGQMGGVDVFAAARDGRFT